METKTCNECGVPIGGANHQALPNNRAINLNDRYKIPSKLCSLDMRSGNLSCPDMAMLLRMVIGMVRVKFLV